MSFEFKDRNAIVTGGGRGMGRAISLALAERGASVIVVDIDPQLADDTARTIHEGGGHAKAMQLDISDTSAVRRSFRSIEGRLDIAVLAAGVIQVKPFLEHDEEDWDAISRVNLKGTFFTLQEAARQMIPNKQGSIVTFASTSAFVASRIPEIAYDVTKGGIRQLTVSAAVELAEHGIRVNGIAPGTILTDFNRATLSTDEAMRKVENSLPLGRVGEVSDVVGAALYLCSSLSSYVTGQLLVVDGGRLCRSG